MPLPSASYTLHGPSQSPVPFRPKQALIVRLSAETLAALDGLAPNAPLDFEFGHKQGIYVGDTFFPMQHHKEDIRHDLYIRTSTLGKPNGSLKLHANVTGKLVVERELTSVARDIKRSANEAAEQRLDRRTILLDGPPPSLEQPKRKKAPSKLARHSAPITSNVTVPPREVSALPPQSPLRQEIIYYLALADRSSEDVLRKIEGPETDSKLNSDVLDILSEVAECDSRDNLWCLKKEVWLEIRPYERPNLDENQRTQLARRCRYACKNGGIPETDPIWEHFRFRANGSGAIGSLPQARSEATLEKRPLMSTTTRPKNGKARASRVSNPSGSSNTTPLEKDDTSRNAGIQRRPGSGYKAPRNSSLERPTDLDRRTPASSNSSGLRTSAREPRQGASIPVELANKPAKALGLPSGTTQTQTQTNGVDTQKRQPANLKDTLKRKKQPNDDEEFSVKRPKTIINGSKVSNAVQQSTSKLVKGSTLPTGKLPRASHSRATGDGGKLGGKSRPKPPVFTSSEDEGDAAETENHKKPIAGPVQTHRSRPSTSLPADHNALREMYGTAYVEYMTVFQRLNVHKAKVHGLLRRMEQEDVSSLVISEDEMDMGLEELREQNAQRAEIEGKLSNIRQVFAA